MQKLSQKGFTLIEGLLIIIAVSLMAGVGYYVYNSNKKTVTVTSTKTTQAPSAQSQSKSAEPQKQYLAFKSAGVKMELTDEIKDAYTGTSGRDLGDIYISTHYFDNLPDFSGCKTDDKDASGIVALSSGKVGEDRFGSPLTESDLKDLGGVKVGDTYYWIEPSNGACFDPNKVPGDSKDLVKLSALKKALVDQGKTITKL